MSDTDPKNQRRTNRKRSDPRAVRIDFKDHNGHSRRALAYLSNMTEGGAGISLMTPLGIGSRVVMHCNLGEGRTDLQFEADVKWCAQGPSGVFNVGLKLVGRPSDDTA